MKNSNHKRVWMKTPIETTFFLRLKILIRKFSMTILHQDLVIYKKTTIMNRSQFISWEKMKNRITKNIKTNFSLQSTIIQLNRINITLIQQTNTRLLYNKQIIKILWKNLIQKSSITTFLKNLFTVNLKFLLQTKNLHQS
mgnify:CR=1 FL=1